jgi:hypothetical protein
MEGLTAFFAEPCKELFASPVTIDIGGIKKIHAQVQCPV